MSRCYICDVEIPRGGGYRRWVDVSHRSFASIGFNGRPRFGVGASQGLRTLCARCAAQVQDREEANARALWVLAAIVVAVVVGVLVLGSLHR